MDAHTVIYRNPLTGRFKVNTGLSLVYRDDCSRPLLLGRGQTFPSRGKIPEAERRNYLAAGKPVPRGTIW
ncbi:hypothetical protein HNR62_000316 [Oceanisphaera litoralis]|uniref:hypothetical protein n=1 Tax=Oceanisphaera litoralis TaxID=225144 RepID=UPI00195A4739|nr:hypothetical protein [Oceanisphaera litoralis]MBM7454487.1 hypothetical protein [Oceanisphaera litoralis]